MFKKIVIACLLIVMLITGAVFTVSGQPEVNAAALVSQDDVQLTVYSQNSNVVVRDTRTFTLVEGLNQVDFVGVSPALNSRSVVFTSDTDGTTLRQQQVLAQDKSTFVDTLRANEGETIKITLIDATEYEGVLMSAEPQLMLQLADGTLVVINTGEIRSYQLATMPTPSGVDAPTLRLLVGSTSAGDQQLSVTYLTQSIYGQANYNLLLARDQQDVELVGWLDFGNFTDADYLNADVTLVAGDFNRLDFVSQETSFAVPTATAFGTDFPQTGGGGGGGFATDQTFIYPVPQRIDILKGQNPYLQFLAGAAITAENVYIYDASPRIYGYSGFITSATYGLSEITQVQNFLSFSAQQNGEDLALLPGQLRIYQEESDGTLLLIGETQLQYIPAGETVQVYLENTDAVTAERRQTEFQQLSNDVIQESFEIRLRNRTAEAIEVRVPERMTRSARWEILGSSVPFEQPDSFGVEFTVEVPAGGETTISYTVLYTRQN